MLVQARSGYNGFGAGLGVLIQTKDFNCNPAICWGIGKENHQRFILLQQRINVLSTLGGFSPIRVDGFIGAETLAALRALHKAGYLKTLPATKEEVAARAPELINELMGVAAVAAATGKPLAPPGTPVAYEPAKPPSELQPVQVPPAAEAAAAAAAAAPKSRMFWWILGGLVGVAAVGGVGYLVYRRKARGF
jgi:hypothetical protein